MTGRVLVTAAIAAAVTLLADAPALPVPVTNNAVAAGRVAGQWVAFSALGVQASRRWSGITTQGATWVLGKGWRPMPPVPGPLGRLAATAQVVRGRLYVFGGYTVDSAGRERSLPDVDVYDPALGTWSLGAPAPVAVDDAVSGTYRDSLVYLVSGWHDTDNVQLVQVYDVTRNTWHVATPIPGPGVFGHTGGLAGNTLLFVDGAARRPNGAKYALVPQAWTGTIDPVDALRIAWEVAPAHPGPAIYRAAAASCGRWIVVAGGTDNPYNYDGIGYDGRPSEPRADVMAFDTRHRSWTRLPPLEAATMDHRGLLVRNDSAFVVGGMRARQQVTAAVAATSLGTCPR